MGRPRKTKVVWPIDEVIKELLSDFEATDGEDSDLFYDSDEVKKEKEGAANWWDNVDCNGELEGDNGGDSESSNDGLFTNTYSFKRALKTYAVQNRFDYHYEHNDMGRVSAICREEHCRWRIHASIDATMIYIQIKTFYPIHICGNQFENSRCDVKYLVCTYKKDFKDDPTWTPYALQQRVKRELNIDVPIDRCYRAKNEALHQIFGSHSKQYRLTRRYALAILSTNPGSSAYVHRDGAFFLRMYICLDACKKGFKYGCRPLICLDACHLKEEYGVQLLYAIGIDSNNHGLGTAVDVVLPYAEHCFCARHLHVNFKANGYTGKAFKDALWGAAQTVNIYAFEDHMQKILSMEKGAHDYLSGVPKASWSMHAFNCQTKSDMLLNNLAECLNAWIKDARSKPILTMIEDIRWQIMARFQQKMNRIRLTQYMICPKIQKKLERSKSDARNCISRWQNELEFEVDHIYDARRIVRLDRHECTCGRWQLNGIPCSHACTAIYMNKQKSEAYVNGYYKMDTYMQCYAARVYGMEGPMTLSSDDPCNVILPPIIRKASGRPKIARKRAANEPINPYKLTCSGYLVKCENCGGLGHNYNVCLVPLNPDRKRWKPKKYKPTNDATQAQGSQGQPHVEAAVQGSSQASVHTRRASQSQESQGQPHVEAAVQGLSQASVHPRRVTRSQAEAKAGSSQHIDKATDIEG
ncbi:uncharacterized protein LOC132187941 [Corylus avellana]|uniref:uncharacterized protein LOC132187941 n=1 Tax=Corylus avellana TaxID=13451 RepID=UPI00286AA9C0|nr:uncharacterized protein LOC132187941 [Corylus avellana]